MKLYTFHQSGSTYRVRIALNLKGIKYEPEYIVVAPNSPDLNNDAYVKLNPQRTAPTFVDGDVVLTQSMAIIEYLEETHPEAALMPKDAAGRARVRTLTQGIVCDTHPIISQRIFQSLKNDFAMDKNLRNPWNQRWVVRGLGIFKPCWRKVRQRACFVMVIHQRWRMLFSCRRYSRPGGLDSIWQTTIQPSHALSNIVKSCSPLSMPPQKTNRVTAPVNINF